MNPIHVPEMLFSSHKGWDDLIRLHPSVIKVFVALVVPFSLLPPAMILLAGSNHPEIFGANAASHPWLGSAVALLVAELAMVSIMAAAIRWVAASHGEQCDYHDAFVLAALFPIPLWLSSLALLIPSLPFIVAAGLASLVLSFSLVYRGVQAFFHEGEQVIAASIAYGVMAIGLLAWGLLLAIGLPFWA